MAISVVKTLKFLCSRVTPMVRMNQRNFGRVCGVDNSPRCSADKMAKAKCCIPVKNMWYKEECCNNPCIDAMPRFDDLYYKISDKDRRYTPTWRECTTFIKAPKKICCFERVDIPPMERRPRKPRYEKKSCLVSKNAKLLMLMPCSRPTVLKCPKMPRTGCNLPQPRCKGGRDPPCCKVFTKKKYCTKIPAPYPSFSECERTCIDNYQLSECTCMHYKPYCHFT